MAISVEFRSDENRSVAMDGEQFAGAKIDPVCSYAAVKCEKNEEYKKLLKG